MKTQRKLLFILFSLGIITSVLFSCKDDENNQTDLLSLSSLSGKTKVGDFATVDISLLKSESVKKIIVEKSVEGKKIDSYKKELDVNNLTFPYSFKEEVVAGDANGILVYSFYAMNADNQVVDAADYVLRVDLAQLPLLLKYDWMLASQTIKGENTATPDLVDDIHRFNPDLTWQVDWGAVLSTMALETLNSYCGWQIESEGATVKKLKTIHYNIFSPSTPKITEYNVMQLADRKLVLESFQDLSALGDGYSSNERVLEVYTPVTKNTDFTPYRGQNPDSYIVSSCNPGSY